MNTALQTIYDALPNGFGIGYHEWVEAMSPTSSDFARLSEALLRQESLPSLDVIIGAGGALDHVVATVASLKQQIWTRFSITIGCPSYQVAELEDRLQAIGIANGIEPSVSCVPVASRDADVLALEQAALEAGRGDYVGFLAQGDKLPSHAIAEIVLALAQDPETEILFTDEDWIDPAGVRSRPLFKNGWDPDAQLGFDLMGRFSPMRRTSVLAIGGLQQQFGLAAHYALHCSLAGLAGPARITHLASVLRHAARQPASSRELAEAYARSARTVAGIAAAQWEGSAVRVVAAPLAPWLNRIEWPLADPAPLVSILLPTRDGAHLLEASALGVLEKTDYPAIELLVLDNGSVEPETAALFGRLSRDPRVRIMPMPGPFNYSKLNNDGAAAARGEIIILLNNDVEIIESDWLREMVSLVSRPEIGCVGAKLLYADRRIQHAGINMGPQTGCAHVGRLLSCHDAGEAGGLAITRTHSAVTAACLAIRSEVFKEVGGLDEVSLKVGYNDVDLCLKVRDHGYRSVCSPFAMLYHMESVSRGPNDSPDKRERERAESAKIIGRWREVFLDDPYQNPNTLLTWEGKPRLVMSRRRREWEKAL